MGLVDPLLMIVLFVFFFRTFGTRPTCVALVIFSMMPFCFDYLAGSLLRWDWLFALGLCLVCWKRGRPLASGALLGYAIASKLFPLFFGVGFACWAASSRESPRTRKSSIAASRASSPAPRRHRVASRSPRRCSGPRDVAGLRERIAVAQHEHTTATNIPSTTVFLQVADSSRASSQNWVLPPDVKRRRIRTSTSRKALQFFFCQLMLTVLVAFGLRLAEPIEAIAIGPFLVYVWLVVNAYYWNMLMLPALAWTARENERPPRARSSGTARDADWFYLYQHLSRRLAEGYSWACSCW